MRTYLTFSLVIVAALFMGCQTQSRKDWSDVEPGAGRDANIPWQVHSGLFEVNIAVEGYGAGQSWYDKVMRPRNERTAETFPQNGMKTDKLGFGGELFFGYMLTDAFEIGLNVSYVAEEHKPKQDFPDFDVRGWEIAPELIWNFSETGTDVVPYLTVSGGYGGMTYEAPGFTNQNVDRQFVQGGAGIRFFGWDGISINGEIFVRYFDDDVKWGNGFETSNNRGIVVGGAVSVSFFF
jgi:hypothetical protein